MKIILEKDSDLKSLEKKVNEQLERLETESPYIRLWNVFICHFFYILLPYMVPNVGPVCLHGVFVKNPEEYQNNVLCPHCGSSHFKAASRSGCFFEIMRLLEETEENAPENMG